MNINTVTVIGATGTMGSNVAGIFASFGNAKVFCIGRDVEKVKRVIPTIIRFVKADCIADHLVPADFSMMEQCVSESDLVFESISEAIDLKKEIAERIGKVIKQSAITCTGTSGLSINEISKCYPENVRSHFFGVHLFNPPYSMPLCEFTATDCSDSTYSDELKRYLRDVLRRTVVEVKDSPAFLGNRIGFQFINEALQYAEKYKDNGGIDYIDAILGPFTGRTMPPLLTSDFVGLDVHKAIVDNLYANTADYAHETFVLPEFVERLIEKGKRGRKTGSGLYQTIVYEEGFRKQLVYDIESGVYRDRIPYVFPFVEKIQRNIAEGDYDKAFAVLINNRSMEADICLSFLLKYIVYSLYSAREVGYTIEAADDVMATGFNWCPPLAMIEAISRITKVDMLIQERLPEISKKIDIGALMEDVASSKYDYRPYFKSGR